MPLSVQGAEAFERVALMQVWLRESISRVARCDPKQVCLWIGYEFCKLTMRCSVPARLGTDPEKAYEHARQVWGDWLRENQEIAFLSDSDSTAAETSALSNADFAARMREMRENHRRGVPEEEAPKAVQALVLWDDEHGGPQRAASP